MKGYLDVYLLPVPKAKLAAYRNLARRFGKVVEKHGALEYREFIAENDISPKVAGFDSLLKPRKGEVLIISIVEFSSRKHRDKVNHLVFEDPAMHRMMTEKPIFDMKRMVYGGFETIVKM